MMGLPFKIVSVFHDASRCSGSPLPVNELRSSVPDARNRCSAARAASVLDRHFQEPVAKPFNHPMAAGRAEGMLVRPYLAREVSSIDIPKPATLPDLRRPKER